MQRAPTSRKSGSNAPYRPINFGGAPEAEIRGSEGNGRMHKPDRRRGLAPLAASRDGETNMKAARIHRAAMRRGGGYMATRGARADEADAAHRRADGIC